MKLSASSSFLGWSFIFALPAGVTPYFSIVRLYMSIASLYLAIKSTSLNLLSFDQYSAMLELFSITESRQSCAAPYCMNASVIVGRSTIVMSPFSCRVGTISAHFSAAVLFSPSGIDISFNGSRSTPRFPWRSFRNVPSFMCSSVLLIGLP